MMLVWLKTEKLKLNNFFDAKMNVIMIQPSLSSQRLTGYWQEQAAGIYQKFYLSSQACSLRLVYCEMPAESFLFSQNCDNWHPAETLSPLSEGWVTARCMQWVLQRRTAET